MILSMCLRTVVSQMRGIITKESTPQCSDISQTNVTMLQWHNTVLLTSFVVRVDLSAIALYCTKQTFYCLWSLSNTQRRLAWYSKVMRGARFLQMKTLIRSLKTAIKISTQRTIEIITFDTDYSMSQAGKDLNESSTYEINNKHFTYQNPTELAIVFSKIYFGIALLQWFQTKFYFWVESNFNELTNEFLLYYQISMT